MSDASHRRRFLRVLSLGTTAGLVPVAGGAADEPRVQEALEAEEPVSETELRMRLIERRYGERLDEEGRRAVRREVEAIVKRAEALRAMPLENGDQPFPVFTPFRALAGEWTTTRLERDV